MGALPSSIAGVSELDHATSAFARKAPGRFVPSNSDVNLYYGRVGRRFGSLWPLPTPAIV